MLIDDAFLHRMESAIRSLPYKNEYAQTDLLTDQFLLYQEKLSSKILEVYYVPFEYINKDARVVIIGITPGWTQTEIAYREAHKYLTEGKSYQEACYLLDSKASFAGPMRTNLVNMLDGIGLNRALRLSTCDQLFNDDFGKKLVHTTSAIRDPVFIRSDNGTVSWENYSGRQPELIKIPVLREYLINRLATELNLVSGSLIIPLGDSVSNAIGLLVDSNLIDPNRCLIGFPHPSGQNGHRIKKYQEHKATLEKTVKQWFNNDRLR